MLNDGDQIEKQRVCFAFECACHHVGVMLRMLGLMGGCLVPAFTKVLEDVTWGLREILIVSYSALIGKHANELKKIKWRLVVFDEVCACVQFVCIFMCATL